MKGLEVTGVGRELAGVIQLHVASAACVTARAMIRHCHGKSEMSKVLRPSGR